MDSWILGPSPQAPRPAVHPISDAIRRRAAAAVTNAVAFAEHWPSGESISLQERATLPPLEDSDLDDPHLLACAAGEIYRMRQARNQVLPQALMSEPAWDILLVLYAEQPERLPVSSVCYASGVSSTTAERWIGTLEKRGLVERTPHPLDRRVLSLSLTNEGRLTMTRALQAMLRAARR